MSVWNNTPNANQIVSATQQPINQNFANTNIWFAVNHVAAGSAGFGKHTVITSVQQGSDPTIAGTDIALYNKADSNSIAQYFVNRLAGGSQQLTGVVPSGTSPNFTWNFADGMQVRYGTISITGTGSLSINQPVTFNTAFPTACFGITFNMLGASSTITGGGTVPTTTGFTYTILNLPNMATKTIFYIAIGN